MFTFHQLSEQFQQQFIRRHFPQQPSDLYDSAEYILSFGGKRIRPVMCLMGNELFGEIEQDCFSVAIAIELFHNFSLIHDDIMDKAPLRRGLQTVHTKYNEPTALLAGDVMLVMAYEYLNNISEKNLHKVIRLFNRTAMQVCEGQQLDMNFEKLPNVRFTDYVKMIELKTSVLLAASLQLGAKLGGAGEGNQQKLYEFGKNIGMAFQVQDDYLDAFGDTKKFGKKIGGDILANKKTFLRIHVAEVASEQQLQYLDELQHKNDEEKINGTLQVYKDCKAREWSAELKDKFYQQAIKHLDDIAVVSVRKKPLYDVAEQLMSREF